MRDHYHLAHYHIPLPSDDCEVLFLEGDENGLRVPFVVDRDEFIDIRLAMEEGLGTTPPVIVDIVDQLRVSRFRVTQIIVIDFDTEIDGFKVSYVARNEMGCIVKECDLVEGLLLAIYDGAAILVSDSVIFRQEETEFGRTIIEIFNDPEIEEDT